MVQQDCSGIIIQKYGGTSVSTTRGRELVVHRIVNSVAKGHKVVVVVSAMGRKGDPYATDTLIDLYNSNFDIKLDKNNRELDLLMSCGETISSVVMSAMLQAVGIDSISLMGFQAGIYTDGNYGDATVQNINTDRILSCLNNGQVPVVAGFQGICNNDDITTLGRGGSDTTAALLAEALQADAVEIYTDVDGVMSADPRVVTNAKKIDHLDYDECYQLSLDGAKVVDYKAVEVARRSKRKLFIKNTFSEDTGTLIYYKERPTYSKMEQGIVTAITSKRGIVQYCVTVSGDDERVGVLLTKLEENNISLDLINFFKDSQVFTVKESDEITLRGILNELKLPYKYTENCCKLTVVGYKIHGVPGVMRRVVEALTRQKISILQSGDSNITISCLIDVNNTERGIMALHDEFGL